MTPSSGSRPIVSSWMRSSSTRRSLATRPTVWTWWTLLRCMSGGLDRGGGLGLPVPGEQLIEPVSGVAGDAGEHVGQPGLGIDVVHLRSDDQAVHGRGAMAAPIRPAEEP